MRVRVSFVLALVVLATGFGAPAIAQFQQPTDEELKMTADPKAPGAAAVYLNVEETVNDPMHYESFYARIKVLTEKGKDLATVEVPYLRGDFKVSDIKARTIHADGTVIPLAGKPEDLLVSKKGDREIGRMVFNLPSVEVGSILEYRYQLVYDGYWYLSPSWEIQRLYFVHKAHYLFTPHSRNTSRYSLIWWSKLPDGVAVKTDSDGRFNLDAMDIPPAPDEEWMPPIQSLLYKVSFYYKAADSVQEYWDDEAKDWSKSVDKFAEQSNTIHEAVAALIAPGDTELMKAQKIYTAVEALENTDYTRKRSESERKVLKLKEVKHAEDTWKQKSGDSEDIALLYLAMARAAGLKAYAMKVVARDRGIFDASYMYMGQLDDTVILLAADGKGYVLDPGEKMAPFNTVSWRHSDAGGVRQSDQGTGFQITPMQQYISNNTSRIGAITLDAKGGVTGSIRIIMSGQEALRWRQRALRNDDTELKKQFDEELNKMVPEGVEAHVDHFLSLDNPETELMAVANLKGTLGSPTGKRMLLPGFFFEARGQAPFVQQEKRLESVDMHYPARESESVTYYLPDGMSLEAAPPDSNIPWAGHAAFGAKTDSKTPGQIVISRTFIRTFTQAKPNEYPTLRGFYQKIAASDQQQLVFALPPAKQGN